MVNKRFLHKNRRKNKQKQLKKMTNSIDNIFEYPFMEDFTTIILAKEEYNIDISHLKYEDEDDFYSFSEDKVYTEKELFEKFNISPRGIKDVKI